jgi:hypothetical protein
VALRASASFLDLVRVTLNVTAPAAAASTSIMRAALPPGASCCLEAYYDDDEDAAAHAAARAARIADAAGCADAALRLVAAVPQVQEWCVVRPRAAGPGTIELVCPKVNTGFGACEGRGL